MLIASRTSLLAKQTRKDQLGDLELNETIILRILNGIDFFPKRMMDVMEDRKVLRLYLELLPLHPSRKNEQ